jgi:magnesium chelatase subunit H
VTLDRHVAGALERVREELRSELPGLVIELHVATEFSSPAALEACLAAIASADIVFVTMLFIDEHVRAILPALEARREACDAMVCAMSAGEIVRQTKLGAFRMDGSDRGPLALLKKLRGGKGGSAPKDGGAAQLAMLKRLPKILRFVPGKAQELRAYFLALSYWLSGSAENLANLVRMLVSRYASGPRRGLREGVVAEAPREYPEVGLYHPAAPGRIVEDVEALPKPHASRGTVGLLLMRSYILSQDTGHYDAVIAALEARGLRVLPVFASGLDARPAIERFFVVDGAVVIDALVSLTGFSLVGGPAFNDARAAEEVLARLDVPYLAVQPLEFQSIETWRASSQGLTAVESTIMLAVPELEGATGSLVFGGRSAGGAAMRGIDERIERLASRVDKLIHLRTSERRDRKVAVVLFNFPPNGGATGTAAYLSVFESLHNTLRALRDEGYRVEVPSTVDDLRRAILEGNAARYGTDANVAARVPVESHVRREPHLAAIEAQWGPAPGRHLTNGSSLFVLGATFGNVFVGVQPAFGYEGDPMRLLFEAGFSPTHAFSAFYRYIREDFAADVVLHFGMHGALEFMPGKQNGLGEGCWPDRLIGDIPHVYLYAANNPSEGALARRRANATLISYLTPPLARAGLYKELESLRQTLDHLRSLPPGHPSADDVAAGLQSQAVELDLASSTPRWSAASPEVAALHLRLLEIEGAVVPTGLHVVGQPMALEARAEFLSVIAGGATSMPIPAEVIRDLAEGMPGRAVLERSSLPRSRETLALLDDLAHASRNLAVDHELPAIVRALDGRFTRPAPGGDIARNPAVLPTGRNIHGLDPFALPMTYAVAEGARQADRILAKHLAAGNGLPESIAIVLWAADNLKSGGGPMAQVLALLGARPRTDSYGRLCGASLIPLEQLGRPRIDVLVTLSGVFRDLLPLQTRMLAEAALLAATADEPPEHNFVRKHVLEHQAKAGCTVEVAALRVFSNAEGAYGANVNQLVESGAWQEEDELAEAFTKRKCFAYGVNGPPVRQQALLQTVLASVDLAYQNLESAELGVLTTDQYFDGLGGVGRAVQRARGGDAAPPAVYIGDQTRGEGRVRTLGEQVALETRTRTLNPKWAEAMLAHGAEGVRQIEAQVSNTLGWSATTAQVEPWVYREIAQTYVLDSAMRDRLAELNPKASVKLANRLLEASERRYWSPDKATLAALQEAGDELENRLEGVEARVA